jgi:hypothetical protein
MVNKKLVDIVGLSRYHENLKGVLNTKQDNIDDLSDIRSGAALGATALQEVPAEYVTEEELAAKTYATVAQVEAKQDIISDLETIREGAALGATALQEVPAEYVTEEELAAKTYATVAQVEAKQDIISDLETIREGAAAGAVAEQNAKDFATALVMDGDKVRFDAAGSASQALTDAKGYADGLNTAMDDRVKVLEAIDHEQLASDASAAAVATVLDGAPEKFDTLKEIAQWISDSESAATAADLVNRVKELEDIDHDAYIAADEALQANIDATKIGKEDVMIDQSSITRIEGIFNGYKGWTLSADQNFEFIIPNYNLIERGASFKDVVAFSGNEDYGFAPSVDVSKNYLIFSWDGSTATLAESDNEKVFNAVDIEDGERTIIGTSTFPEPIHSFFVRLNGNIELEDFDAYFVIPGGLNTKDSIEYLKNTKADKSELEDHLNGVYGYIDNLNADVYALQAADVTLQSNIDTKIGKKDIMLENGPVVGEYTFEINKDNLKTGTFECFEGFVWKAELDVLSNNSTTHLYAASNPDNPVLTIPASDQYTYHVYEQKTDGKIYAWAYHFMSGGKHEIGVYEPLSYDQYSFGIDSYDFERGETINVTTRIAGYNTKDSLEHLNNIKADKSELESNISTLRDDVDYHVNTLQANIEAKLATLQAADATLQSNIEAKQDIITDLQTIREGAALGATALQEVPAEYVTEEELAAKTYATETYVNEKVAALVDGAPETLDTLDELAAALKDNADIVDVLTQSIGLKQDTITDLETIRSGAALGATALQEVPAEYVTEDELTGKGYLTADDFTFAQDSEIDALFN